MEDMKQTRRIAWGCQMAALGLMALLLHGSLAVAREKYTMPTLKEQPAAVDRDGRVATSFAAVVKRVAPSVVTVYSTRVIREQPFWAPFLDDPIWRRFFGEPPDGRRRAPRERRARGLGSGVIVSEDGFILTNNHVVEGADELKVRLADGKTEYPATVVGNDPQTDIAVLKVDARKLPAITITDSDKLEVGDVVLAIGNPFGVGQTVTMGIVSATGRGGLGITDYEDFIQTDAAINMGNSGGALVDAEGRLVGINTAILSRTGGNLGVSFAVPVNMARNVMERLLSDGKIRRGYLGVFIQSLTPDLVKAFSLPDQNGALVSGVSADGPAAKAGIKEGDVIVELNGKKVEDSRQLRLMVAQSAPGTRANLKVIRDGKPRSFSIILGELPESESVVGSAEGQQELDALDGVELADLDANARREFDIPAHVRGALVTDVAPDCNAAEAGLRPGDVILEINRQPVSNADSAIKLANQARTDRLLLRVWSRQDDQSGSRYLTVDNSRRNK